MDLAEAHMRAIEHLLEQQTPYSLTLNIGTGCGLSVLEMVQGFEKATGLTIPYEIVGAAPAMYLGWKRAPGKPRRCSAGVPAKAWRRCAVMAGLAASQSIRIPRPHMSMGGLLVLAGGGHSHALVLKRWVMQPEQRPKQSIVLVNRSSTALYSGMVPGLIAGRYQRDEIAIDLRQLCDQAGVAFMETEITGLDPQDKSLRLQNRPALHFGWLSLDVGAMSRPSAAGIPIKPLEASLAFIESEDPCDPKPLRVIGAGAAGLEVVLALRRRWPQRELQLQQRSGQVDRGIQEVLQRARIELIENNTPHNGPNLLCTGSQGPAWLATAGLPVDTDGRIRTDRYLRVEGHPSLFASGDCAVISADPRPASGVWAVRAGRPLATNLEAACKGQPLRPWYPQSRALQLVGNHEEAAWARWGGWRLGSSNLLWRLKQRIDRAFMAGFQKQGSMADAARIACRGCAA